MLAGRACSVRSQEGSQHRSGPGQETVTPRAGARAHLAEVRVVLFDESAKTVDLVLLLGHDIPQPHDGPGHLHVLAHEGAIHRLLVSDPRLLLHAGLGALASLQRATYIARGFACNGTGVRCKRSSALDRGVGVDVEPASTFAGAATEKRDFLERNFTVAELEHCLAAASPADSLAGRWAAKEAVIKAMSSASPQTRSLWQGGTGRLLDIEIKPSSSGAPVAVLHGHAKAVFEALGLTSIKLSISHSAGIAVAQALAT